MTIAVAHALDLHHLFVKHAIYAWGLSKSAPPSLDAYSLAEMLEAARIAREQPDRDITLPDDYIAALYLARVSPAFSWHAPRALARYEDRGVYVLHSSPDR